MNPFRLLLALVLLAPTVMLAQNEAAKHTCRILFFNAPTDAPQKLFLFDGATSQEVELPKMNFSPIYEFAPGGKEITLLPEAIDDPEKIPAGAPKVIIPEGVVDFYLLVTSDEDNKVAPVQMQVINAGMDSLKPGQMLWFNHTPNTIEGEVGTQSLLLEPNSQVILDSPALVVGQFLVQLSYKIPGEDRMLPLCSTSWGFDPRSRSIIFVSMEPGARAPRVRGFSDFRE